jgi:hypothetical protein
MAFELDHLFIWTEPGAPAAQRLIDFGLTEGPSNIHPGQGTANRRFFFHNAMVELLWVQDWAETQSALTAPTTLGDRWQQRGNTASSFGLCLRPQDPASTDLPFEGWAYHPAYLPAHLSVWIGDNATQLLEPFSFYLSFGQRPDAKAQGKRPPLDHPAGLKEISAVRLISPHVDHPSAQLQAIARTPGITVESGDPERMEIIFDQGNLGQLISFMPDLPLCFRW